MLMLHSFPVYMQYCEWFAFLRTFVLHSICNMSTPCNTMNILDSESFLSLMVTIPTDQKEAIDKETVGQCINPLWFVINNYH